MSVSLLLLPVYFLSLSSLPLSVFLIIPLLPALSGHSGGRRGAEGSDDDTACHPDYKVKSLRRRSHTNSGSARVTPARTETTPVRRGLNPVYDVCSLTGALRKTLTRTHARTRRTTNILKDGRQISLKQHFGLAVCIGHLQASGGTLRQDVGVISRGSSFCHTAPQDKMFISCAHVCV